MVSIEELKQIPVDQQVWGSHSETGDDWWERKFSHVDSGGTIWLWNNNHDSSYFGRDRSYTSSWKRITLTDPSIKVFEIWYQ